MDDMAEKLQQLAQDTLEEWMPDFLVDDHRVRYQGDNVYEVTSTYPGPDYAGKFRVTVTVEKVDG